MFFVIFGPNYSLWHKINARTDIVKLDLRVKASLCKILCKIDQNLNFHNGVGGYLGHCHVTKNAETFARDPGAKFVVKGSKKLE